MLASVIVEIAVWLGKKFAIISAKIAARKAAKVVIKHNIRRIIRHGRKI